MDTDTRFIPPIFGHPFRTDTRTTPPVSPEVIDIELKIGPFGDLVESVDEQFEVLLETLLSIQAKVGQRLAGMAHEPLVDCRTTTP